MGMVVRTNTMALNAYRQLGMNNNAVSKSLEKLSSGFRINRAGDDAAGLAISEKMKAQITGLETASANAQDGISLIQTAEGNLTEVHSMLNRMVELATKSANGTYTVTERDALQDEVDSLLDEINRISQSANFNGTNLLDGSLAANNAIKDSNINSVTLSASYTMKGASLGVSVINDSHLNTSTKTEKTPAFKIDLVDFKVTLPANPGATDVTYAVSLGAIGGTAVTVVDATTDLTTASTLAFTVAGTTATTTDKAADDIAGLFNNKFAVIGDAVYEMKATGTTIAFTYAGAKKSDGTFADKTTDDGKPKDNMAITGNVTINVDTGVGTSNRVNCHIEDITDAQAGSAVKRAGATLTLTDEIIKRGSLTIGGTKFVFDANTDAPANGTPAATNAATITIGTKGLTGAELRKAITEQMSHCSVTTSKKIGGTDANVTFMVGRGANNDTIEIEEVPQGTGSYGAFTKAELQDMFSQTVAATKAKAEITLSKDAGGNFVNVSAGNTLTVDGTEYKFVDGTANTSANEISVGKDVAETLNNISAKLNGTYTVNPDTANGTITIQSTSDTQDEVKVSYSARTVDDGGLTLQIGDTADKFNKMTVAVEDMSAKGLDLDGLKITTEKNASDAISRIKTAINTVSTARAGMGALQNRLEHTINNLDVAVENLSAANSRIRDTDMAKEMMNYTKMNVLVQSAQAMLAQANQQPQSVLQLLQ